MFLSSGSIIETVEADLKSLGRVLKEYIAKKFTGYVNYRNIVQGVYISISMVNGSIVGCRAVDRGVIYEGTVCSDTAMRYLYQPEGVIEVVDVPKKGVLIDLVVFPLSRLEERTALITSLGPEAMVAPSIPPSIEVTAPSTVKVEEKVSVSPIESVPEPSPPSVAPTGATEEKPVEKQVEVISPQLPAQPIPTVAKEISIANECIDPLTLYSVMRSSQIIETVSVPLTLEKIIEKIKEVAQEKKPRYVYISGNVEDAFLRIVHDTTTANIYIEFEKSGAPICGNEALDVLKNKSASNIRIWTVSP